ncbi:MAG: sigma-54-dependent Fis family transcriptional regulator, partial [Desulfovermiculus sp.]|nr:sigma-54-dependent Fis family transcriptional regulator [Desulfovermiculus sp.]
GRIIAATHRDLEKQLAQGEFRQDLYYRLKVFPIDLPPLRKRREDLPLLVSHFIAQQNKRTGKEVTGLDPQAMRLLLDYEWPGNVRELENAIEHAFVLASENMLRVSDLPEDIGSVSKTREQAKDNPWPQVAEGKPHDGPVNKEQLVTLLQTCQWNKAEVARQLGVSRTAVWKYMKKWDIPLKPEDRQAKQEVNTRDANGPALDNENQMATVKQREIDPDAM